MDAECPQLYLPQAPRCAHLCSGSLSHCLTSLYKLLFLDSRRNKTKKKRKVVVDLQIFSAVLVSDQNATLNDLEMIVMMDNSLLFPKL